MGVSSITVVIEGGGKHSPGPGMEHYRYHRARARGEHVAVGALGEAPLQLSFTGCEHVRLSSHNVLFLW